MSDGKGCSCGAGQPKQAVDFAEYVPLLEEVYARIKVSVKKHGDWSDYPPEKVHEAIDGEYDEFCRAKERAQVMGPHGQIDELYDVIVTAAKGIRRLSCLE
jgi:hypothetical protein